MTGIEVLSDNWYTLRKATFDFQGPDGQWRTEHREAYDRGNGATVLLYDPDRGTIVLTRQFRMPAFLNDHPDGMLIETPGGLLDGDDAVDGDATGARGRDRLRRRPSSPSCSTCT